jgi:hypothetical protein
VAGFALVIAGGSLLLLRRISPASG